MAAGMLAGKVAWRKTERKKATGHKLACNDSYYCDKSGNATGPGLTLAMTTDTVANYHCCCGS